MNNVTHSKRYLSHELSIKYYAVKLYQSSHDISFVCRRYKISKASLMRWNRRFDETKESLRDKSHRPKTPHPSAHTEEELKWIRDYHRRNPSISVCELYGKLRTQKGYYRHPGSLYRIFVKLGYRKSAMKKKKSYTPKPYLTPTQLGVKWQSEFCYASAKQTDRIHPLDLACNKLCITHKRIRPRTPRHNGKVERSHRNDQERFL